jgi:hypothetical protein
MSPSVEEREQDLGGLALAIVRQRLDPRDGFFKSPIHHRISAPTHASKRM